MDMSSHKLAKLYFRRMALINYIKKEVKETLNRLYGLEFDIQSITINQTKPEFEGEYTLVLFSFVKQLKKSPEQLGQEIGEALIQQNPSLFSSFNIIKGFLNLSIQDAYWQKFLAGSYNNTEFGFFPARREKVMVEYSSPNTNKPLHLGHLRNNFLGWSVAEILKACGYEII